MAGRNDSVPVGITVLTFVEGTIPIVHIQFAYCSKQSLQLACYTCLVKSHLQIIPQVLLYIY
jgi:hypothetical protein